MVEQAKGSACSISPTSSTEIVYSPSGSKLALMNGASLVKAFVPLPGGAQAVYNSTGLQYYRHPDWLGSSRLATTSARTLYYSGAYAPFGENYAQSGTQDLSFTGQNRTPNPVAPEGRVGCTTFSIVSTARCKAAGFRPIRLEWRRRIPPIPRPGTGTLTSGTGRSLGPTPTV
jgi:hypothetical protein